MFVRIKRRQLAEIKWRSSEPRYGLYAVLLESERVDGKPVQRFVKYLASIEEGDVNRPLVQAQFWRKVRAGLDEIGVSQQERAKIEAKLQETVPFPSVETVAGMKALASILMRKAQR